MPAPVTARVRRPAMTSARAATALLTVLMASGLHHRGRRCTAVRPVDSAPAGPEAPVPAGPAGPVPAVPAAMVSAGPDPAVPPRPYSLRKCSTKRRMIRPA